MKRLLIVLAAVLSSLITIAARCDQSEYEEMVIEIAEEYSVSPELVEAIIETESNWKADAKNGSCKGLMQINEPCHKERMKRLGVTDLMDPYSNILVGVDYLAELIEKYEDIGTVLNGYNMGTKGIKLGLQGKYIKYTKKILKRAEELEKEHGKI